MSIWEPPDLLSVPGIPAGFSFRPIRQGDGDALYHACFTGRSRPHFLTRFRHSLKEQTRGRRLHIMAVTKNGIIGTGKLIRLPGRAEIADLLVVPSRRNHGVGTAMIHFFLAKATEWDYERVEIGATISNTRALDLYRRLGFGEEREITPPGKEPVILLTWRIETYA